MSKDVSRGRPNLLNKEERINRIIAVLANLQQRKGGVLRFKDIHEEFVKKRIISNIKYRGNTRRLLRKLIEMGYLEQLERGEYRLKVAPKPFQVIELIKEIQESYGDGMIYEWRVGGQFWTLAEGAIFGLPRNIDENPIYKLILEVLILRLANIFNAIVELGIAAKASKGIKSAPIPYMAVREFLLNSLPHVVGERSGIDGDGLPAEDVLELYRRLLEDMPDEVNGQPVLTDIIEKYIDVGKKLLNNSVNISGSLDETLIESNEDREVWSKARELEKIVLVAHPPRHLIDENEDERELYELVKESIEKGYSDAMMLAHLKVYDEDVVERVMNNLKPMLGRKRKSDLMQLYKLARAGMVLDSVVASYLLFKKRKGKPKYIEYEDELFGKVVEINRFADKTEEEVLSELREKLEDAKRRGYTIKDMVKGIWLSDWSLNIVPRFTFIHYDGSEDIVNFVKKSVRETFEAIGIGVPRNFDALIEEGHKLIKDLDELLKSDTKRVMASLREALTEPSREDDAHE